MADEGYNGWSNYETWVMAFWIDNDRGSYGEARGMANEAIDDAGTIENPGRSAQGLLADALRDWQEETMPELDASVWSDFLSASFGQVDWCEIAESILSELTEVDA